MLGRSFSSLPSGRSRLPNLVTVRTPIRVGASTASTTATTTKSRRVHVGSSGTHGQTTRRMAIQGSGACGRILVRRYIGLVVIGVCAMEQMIVLPLFHVPDETAHQAPNIFGIKSVTTAVLSPSRPYWRTALFSGLQGGRVFVSFQITRFGILEKEPTGFFSEADVSDEGYGLHARC